MKRDLTRFQKSPANSLQAVRLRRGHTQAQAAKAMGLSMSLVCRIESGSASVVTIRGTTKRLLRKYYGAALQEHYQ